MTVYIPANPDIPVEHFPGVGAIEHAGEFWLPILHPPVSEENLDVALATNFRLLIVYENGERDVWTKDR